MDRNLNSQVYQFLVLGSFILVKNRKLRTGELKYSIKYSVPVYDLSYVIN